MPLVDECLSSVFESEFGIAGYLVVVLGRNMAHNFADLGVLFGKSVRTGANGLSSKLPSKWCGFEDRTGIYERNWGGKPQKFTNLKISYRHFVVFNLIEQVIVLWHILEANYGEKTSNEPKFDPKTSSLGGTLPKNARCSLCLHSFTFCASESVSRSADST